LPVKVRCRIGNYPEVRNGDSPSLAFSRNDDVLELARVAGQWISTAASGSRSTTARASPSSGHRMATACLGPDAERTYDGRSKVLPPPCAATLRRALRGRARRRPVNGRPPDSTAGLQGGLRPGRPPYPARPWLACGFLTRPTRDGGKRYRVMYRLGGRDFSNLYGGSFRTHREARLRRAWTHPPRTLPVCRSRSD
jgi:hypothetical protein